MKFPQSKIKKIEHQIKIEKNLKFMVTTVSDFTFSLKIQIDLKLCGQKE